MTDGSTLVVADAQAAHQLAAHLRQRAKDMRAGKTGQHPYVAPKNKGTRHFSKAAPRSPAYNIVSAASPLLDSRFFHFIYTIYTMDIGNKKVGRAYCSDARNTLGGMGCPPLSDDGGSAAVDGGKAVQLEGDGIIKKTDFSPGNRVHKTAMKLFLNKDINVEELMQFLKTPNHPDNQLVAIDILHNQQSGHGDIRFSGNAPGSLA